MTRCFTPRPVAAAQKGPEDYTFFLFIFGLFGVEKEEEEEGEGEEGGGPPADRTLFQPRELSMACREVSR